MHYTTIFLQKRKLLENNNLNMPKIFFSLFHRNLAISFMYNTKHENFGFFRNLLYTIRLTRQKM